MNIIALNQIDSDIDEHLAVHHKKVIWFVYDYFRRDDPYGYQDGEGEGGAIAWNGEEVLHINLSHNKQHDTTCCMSAKTKRTTLWHLFQDEDPIRDDSAPSQELLAKARQLALVEIRKMCPLIDAPDYVIADWFDDNLQFDLARILR